MTSSSTKPQPFIAAGLGAGERAIALATQKHWNAIAKDLLWKADTQAAPSKLETMWNQLAHSHEFALLCGYAMGHFYKAAAPRELHDLHTHVWSDKSDGASLAH